MNLTIHDIYFNTHTHTHIVSFDALIDFLTCLLVRSQVWSYSAVINFFNVIICPITNFIFPDFIGCKLLYKHDLGKRWGSHCKMCSYCLQTSPKLIQNNLGGKVEDFCCEECMSKYTVLFYQVKK